VPPAPKVLRQSSFTEDINDPNYVPRLQRADQPIIRTFPHVDGDGRTGVMVDIQFSRLSHKQKFFSDADAKLKKTTAQVQAEAWVTSIENEN
jgi:hypothetical protein